MVKEAKCNNCNYRMGEGRHPYMCTNCVKALQDKGVKCSVEIAKRGGRKPWWVK